MTRSSLDSLKIGILGGGQLGSLLIDSFRRSECECIVYAQSVDEPACSLVSQVIIGDKNDREKLGYFFSLCNFVILESEFYSPSLLKELEVESDSKVFPSLTSYERLYSKVNQKQFFIKNNISCAQSKIIRNKKNLEEIFSGPYMAKQSTGGYDGYGNLIIESKDELLEKLEIFSSGFSREIVLEKFIDIKEEFAVMLVKGAKNYIILPPCKTIQKDSVCELVSYPSNYCHEILVQINESMEKIANSLDGIGVFAFEFFLTKNGEIIVNEAAPRVHNSYHFSIEAFDRSQFDLVRDIVMGIDLNDVKEVYPYATMVNLLGTSNSSDYFLTFPYFNDDTQFKIHLYGKKEMRNGRKMGHVTLYGDHDNFLIAQKINEEYRL